MRALVVGAGAVGAAIASRIHDSAPGDVALCASESRRERYAREGVTVNGKRYDFALADPANPLLCDLVILAVKNRDLPDAMLEMAPFIGEGTTILSLLNGITSEEILRETYGPERVPLAMIIGIDAVRNRNEVSFNGIGEIRFGEERNIPGTPTARIAAVSEFLAGHNVPNSIPADMIRQLWYKFMINVAVNQWTALLGLSYGDLQKNRPARQLVIDTMREVIALSGALGTGLIEGDIDVAFRTLDGLHPGGKTSMLQDVEARRPTEVDAFAGVVLEKCRLIGLSAPINSALYLALKALEAAFH